SINASATIIATGPSEATKLVNHGESASLNEWAQMAVPVRAACLDLALKHLPEPNSIFALGIDAPLYFSVHSATAQLAPEGAAVIHAAKYLSSESSIDARQIEAELEKMIELLQPGWRELVIERRFLPKMTVSHGLVTAMQGGLTGRPGPEVPGVKNLFVAGDWVGPEGMLADASIASAKLAAEMVLSKENYRSAAA
ncbi:MAG TPA: hypothetical protein VEF04_14210, partial [Blastocatellia bacterium]|nr:hypothetical protein [Blastocatellia bacterium]